MIRSYSLQRKTLILLISVDTRRLLTVKVSLDWSVRSAQRDIFGTIETILAMNARLKTASFAMQKSLEMWWFLSVLSADKILPWWLTSIDRSWSLELMSVMSQADKSNTVEDTMCTSLQFVLNVTMRLTGTELTAILALRLMSIVNIAIKWEMYASSVLKVI